MMKPTLTATGYAVRDAEAKTSQSGKDYTRVSVRCAVEDEPKDGGRPSSWFVDAYVFGRERERAARVTKGAAVAFQGALSRRRYGERAGGGEREVWSCLCDSFAAAVAPAEAADAEERAAEKEREEREEREMADACEAADAEERAAEKEREGEIPLEQRGRMIPEERAAALEHQQRADREAWESLEALEGMIPEERAPDLTEDDIPF